MKIRLLILLLVCCGTANAQDSEEQSVDNESPKQGDTIWLEEKISPTTTWIENLVKPLTVWMEQQINEPEQELDIQEGIQENSPRGEEQNVPNIVETGNDNIVDPDSLISAEQASALAKKHIAGDVLYIKLISKSNQYRVKLISKLGEIHIIYIKAISGEIISPNGNVGIEPVKPSSSGQGEENREKP